MTKNIFLNKKYRLFLINLIKKNKNIIESFIRDEMANHDNNDFSFREFNENFYVSVSKSYKHGVIKFNLGFPFPVFSMEEKIKKKGTKDFSFHFKGEELRLEQRNILKNIFNKTSIKSNWEELDSIGLFREKFDKTIKNFKFDKLLYVDPYSFIGDSFIGMHFIDGLIKKYKFNERIIFSKSSPHISLLGETYDYDKFIIKKMFATHKCLVFPDLLDINFEETVSILYLLAGMDGLIILPGRSIFIHLNKNRINFFHFNQEDIILRDQNIEDYMNACLWPFINHRRAYQLNRMVGDKNMFFINPFGSLDNKTLDVNFVFHLCQELNRRSDVKINIIAGLKDCYFHRNWVKKFIELEPLKKIDYKLSYYRSLSELTVDFYRLRPGVILTADTSISHLANRLNLLNVVLFHAVRFDNTSIQSMISESPLGFGRYFKNNYPLLIKKYEDYLPKLIADFLTFLVDVDEQKNISKKDKLINNLEIVFPEKYFYYLMPAEFHKTIKKILKKISPIAKLKKI